MKNQRIGTCPVCSSENVRLVEHHWYEDDSHLVGHIRLICTKCNMKLRTKGDKGNHIFSSWEEQVEYLQNYTKPKPNTTTFYLPVEYSEELKRIADFKRQNPSQWCKDRIIAVLKKNMRGNPPLTG